MAKARAIVKRRKAVRNIRKITKTMQLIATTKFQKSLKRAVAMKPFTEKLREVVAELAGSIEKADHPLLREVDPAKRSGRVANVVVTSDRGLCGAYNGSVIRAAAAFIRQREQAGLAIDLYAAGKKGYSYFNYQKRAVKRRLDQVGDEPTFETVAPIAQQLMDRFIAGEVDSVHVTFMNFISSSRQRSETFTLLPLAGLQESADHLGRQVAEKEAQVAAGSMDLKRTGDDVSLHPTVVHGKTLYDFSPSAADLLDELLPATVKVALFQCFLDAVTSENVARMIAMKSATDNADKLIKSLTMQYNRARQTQITTELSEIMGGVEAMK